MTSTKKVDPHLRATIPTGITSAVGGSLVRWLFQAAMVVFVITIGLAKCLPGTISDELAAARKAE